MDQKGHWPDLGTDKAKKIQEFNQIGQEAMEVVIKNGYLLYKQFAVPSDEL